MDGVIKPLVCLTDDFTEELLNLHEAEVRTLKQYHEDHKELFEGVLKWQENWTLYLELDVSSLPINLTGTYLKQTFLVCVCLCADTCFVSEKGKRPFKVQQQRWEPS